MIFLAFIPSFNTKSTNKSRKLMIRGRFHKQMFEEDQVVSSQLCEA